MWEMLRPSPGTNQWRLDYMVRTENPSGDLPEQREVRRLNAKFHGELSAEEIQVEELGFVIFSLPRKTPGPEKMEVAVLQMVWDLCPEPLQRVLAKCLESGCFPKIWNRGELCLLKKSPEVPSFNPASHRPICLLPILREVLEKVIARRVQLCWFRCAQPERVQERVVFG
jgi:hypothetical protein